MSEPTVFFIFLSMFLMHVLKVATLLVRLLVQAIHKVAWYFIVLLATDGVGNQGNMHAKKHLLIEQAFLP